MHQQRHYPNRPSGTDMINPDFAALAAAYGAHGERVMTSAEFPAALERARASGKPAIIELKRILPRCRIAHLPRPALYSLGLTRLDAPPEMQGVRHSLWQFARDFMRADIHAPTVRIIKLWHDADVDKSAHRHAQRRFVDACSAWFQLARPGAINRCIHSTRVSSRPDCCTA